MYFMLFIVLICLHPFDRSLGDESRFTTRVILSPIPFNSLARLHEDYRLQLAQT